MSPPIDAGSAQDVPRTIHMEIPSSVELVNVVRMTILNAVESVGALSGSRLDDLRLAASEAVTNAIDANLARDPTKPVKIRCELMPGRVILEVSDSGLGMPSERELPPITDPARLRTEGGFGVPLMRSLSGNHVEFTSSEEGTTVRVILTQ